MHTQTEQTQSEKHFIIRMFITKLEVEFTTPLLCWQKTKTLSLPRPVKCEAGRREGIETSFGTKEGRKTSAAWPQPRCV